MCAATDWLAGAEEVAHGGVEYRTEGMLSTVYDRI